MRVIKVVSRIRAGGDIIGVSTNQRCGKGLERSIPIRPASSRRSARPDTMDGHLEFSLLVQDKHHAKLKPFLRQGVAKKSVPEPIKSVFSSALFPVREPLP